MASTRKRQLRREKQRVERRREAQEMDARETQRQQALAAARHDFARQVRRHRAAYALWVLAIVLAVSHIFEHTNTIRLMSPGAEDVLIGWPMAGVLALVGGIVYGT